MAATANQERLTSPKASRCVKVFAAFLPTRAKAAMTPAAIPSEAAKATSACHSL